MNTDKEQEETFEEYLGNARSEFIEAVDAQEWNNLLRTEAENILIAYDQMRERLFPTTPPAEEKTDAVFDVLTQCKEYFEDKMDADYADGNYKPNKEMGIMVGIEHVLERYFPPKYQPVGDELEFFRCSECDGHDACEDFGCYYEMED